MKRIPRDPEKFEVIDLVNAVGKKSGFKIGDEEGEARILARLSESYHKTKINAGLLHGRRTEAMFGYVAASLGKCKLVKQDDSGDIYAASPTLRVPDYHVVMQDGSDFYVEVKNFHQAKPLDPFQATPAYLESLLEYAALFHKGLKLAVYWSRWNIWTLVPVEALATNGARKEISFTEATKVNEMSSVLGDFLLATTPPLVLRLRADQSQPRQLDASGNVVFTIGAVEFYCGGQRVDDKFEKNLAFYLMLHGGWDEKPPTPEINGGRLDSIDFEYNPEESTPGQEFQMIGWLSSMASNRYNDLTLSESGVERLSPDVEPDSLVFHIPPGHKGQRLPLWRFIVNPPKKA